MAWAIRERCYSPGLAPGRYARQDLSDEASDDAAVRARLMELASQRGPRFGYWRLGLVLGREGIKINKKKALPALQRGTAGVRRRGDRKRALSAPAPMVVPQGLDLRWSLDFVADTLAHGRRFRFLVLVDDFTRERLGLVVDPSLTGLRVLDRIAEARVYPARMVSDNGPNSPRTPVVAATEACRRPYVEGQSGAP